MPGTYQYDVEIKSNVAKLLSDMKQVKDRLDTVEGKEYKIKLNVDEKKLSSVISSLEKMLDSLGKGTGDFKQFENLSKELSSIVSEVQSLSKAFGKVDDSGAKTLLSSIQDIDKSLSELSQNILNVNKNMSNMGGNTSGAVKQVENITNESKKAASALEDVAKVQAKVNGQKTNISSGSTMSVIDNQIKKQNEYNDLVAVGYDRIQKMKKISESGTTGSNSVYDLLRLNHEAWDEVKANNFFNTIPEEGLKRYTKILEVVKKIVQEMVQASGLTEEQIVSQLKNIKTAQGGSFKLNGADSGWTHFATYSNGQKDSMQKVNGITYKVYAAFDDIKDLNQNVVSSIMDELTKAGFKGRLKTTSGSTSFGDKLNGLAITDQMVVHGSTKKDQEIAYNTLKNMGLKLSYLGGGIDTPDGSFSQTLASGEINKYIQGLEKEATAARDTAKAEQQLAEARKESSTASTEQRKDAFPKTSENLEQVAQSEQKVQQEAVETDKALDNISFTPNTEGFDDIIAKFGILREQAEQITKIIKTTKQTADGTPDISYKATLKNGSSYYLGENSTPQVLNASETVYDAKVIAKNAEQEASVIQAEWDKNIKAIQNYMDAVTKLNNLKAKDKGTGSEANQIALQTQNVEELKQAAWDARQNLSSIQAENPDIIAWKQWVDMMELFDQASKGSAESAAKLKDVLDNIKAPSLDKYENKLSSYQAKKDSYDATIARFSDGGWTSPEYLKNVQAVKDAVAQYETLLNKIKIDQNGIASEEDIQNLKVYKSQVEETIATVKNMSASEKGYNFVSGQKELDKIHKLLIENSKMSTEAKNKIRAFYAEIESGNPSMSLDRIHGEIMKIYNAEVEAGRAGKSFFDTLKNSGFHQIAAQMAGMFGVYDVINIGKEAISTIVSLDDALVDLKKTTAMNKTQLEDFYYDANDVAKQMGVTTEEIITQASAWSRLGYSSQEAATTMAKLSSKFASISPGMSTDEAQEGLVSIMKAFDIDPDDVETEIMDKVNVLGNKFAEENQDVIEGLKRSAAAMSAMGQSFTDTAALFTGGMEILQDSESMGTALRTLSMRVRGYDEETNQLSDDLVNVTGEVADLTKTAKDSQGVSLFTDATQEHYRSMVEYLGDIADRWDQISEKNQTELLQKLFGKNRANESVCPYVQKCA